MTADTSRTNNPKERPMKYTKRMICILAILFFAVGSMAVAVHAAQGTTAQTKCPVLGGDIDKNVYVDYEGKRIYFCCAGCPEEFKKDPAKYMKKLKEQGVTLEATPKN
jgi:YHS domain-containing protein